MEAVSLTGLRNATKVVSTEREKNITVVLEISPTGVYVQPFLIFDQKRTDKQLVEAELSGSFAICNGNGWMISNGFLLYLENFCRHVKLTAENPKSLIFFNNVSYVFRQDIIFCRKHNITMLGFSPHTTRRLQPLDVAVFGSLITYNSQACDKLIVNNLEQAIIDRDIRKLFCEAYNQTATVENASQGWVPMV